MKAIKDKYIGPYAVVGYSEVKDKTPLGGEVIKVIFESRPSRVMSFKTFEALATDQPTDFNTVETKRNNLVIPKLIEILAEYDVTMASLPGVLERTHATITDHFERASNYLWTGDDRNWIHGENYMNDRTLTETHHILLGINKDNSITKKTDDPGERARK